MKPTIKVIKVAGCMNSWKNVISQVIKVQPGQILKDKTFKFDRVLL